MGEIKAIDQAMSRKREAQAREAETYEPPTIQTINDIKRVLLQLDPSVRLNQRQDDVQVTTEMLGSDGRKPSQFQVKASSSSQSYRDMLLEGFQLVKQRQEALEKIEAAKEQSAIEINDRPMMPAPVVSPDSEIAIDAIIERILGGRRDDGFVRWDLADGYTYKYEIFQHRLTRISRDA